MKTKKLMQQMAVILIAVGVIGAGNHVFAACKSDSARQCTNEDAACTNAKGAASTCTQGNGGCLCP